MQKYLKFKCVFCGQSMECDPQHVGRQIQCPACSHKIAIPPDPKNKARANADQGDMTWIKDVPTPDVSTPTRYISRDNQKPSTQPDWH